MELSDELVREGFYTISRGVRPMVLLGAIEADPDKVSELFNYLQCIAWEEDVGGGPQGVIPIGFVVQEQGGLWARAGYAARGWIPETYKWLLENAPQEHLHRLVGLLLGYSVDSIAMHEEFSKGGLFPVAIDMAKGLSTATVKSAPETTENDSPNT